MTTLPPLDPDAFQTFFQAVHDRSPFPWQSRLVRQVAETGWPELLDLPTGSGKTAALDVAVFSLALDAGRSPRSAPLRIVYVVDRRTIVDQAFTRAVKIRHALLTADHEVVRSVRERLAMYSDGGVPLWTAYLRGGIARDDAWARAPDQPLIAVSTVDQVGSRLLFRGYGVTDSMKPVHAGLLGSDVLYLLDEVHLSQPFRETLAAIKNRYRDWSDRRLPGSFCVVEMSATPGRSLPDSFRLNDADHRNPVLSKRLTTSKPVSLVATNARAFLKEIEGNVLSLLDRPGATIAVVVNRVKSARDLHARLCTVVPGGADVVRLLTGRMRPFDRDAIEQSLLDRIGAGRNRSATDPPIVVVATQCIEAGADFDFDDLVSECASLDALRQRFGRLDRLGDLAGSGRGLIVARNDSLKDDPVYGAAIGATWEWLQARANGQVVDFGLSALSPPADVDEQLMTPKSHAPILLPSHLDAWVQTAPMPEPDPDVALWLHGPQRGVADVLVVWRGDLPEDLLNQAIVGGVGAAAAEEVALSIVEAIVPVSAEAMSVPFTAARRWLDRLPEPESFDVEGAMEDADEPPPPGVQAAPRPAVVWLGEDSHVVQAKDLRPGQTLVVPASYGGIEHGNWAPSAQTPVKDVAELAAFRQGRQPTLRLHEAVLKGHFQLGVEVPIPASFDPETPNDRATVLLWLEGRHAEADADFRSLLDKLHEQRHSLRVERRPRAQGENADEYFVLVGRPRPSGSDGESEVEEAVTAESSRSSFTGVEVSLASHLNGVAAIASGFAERLGLPAEVVADLRLAGEWHDAGKVDPRFQRWLHGGSEFKVLVQETPLAKGIAVFSSPTARRLARERAGYPAGGRHELMSIALMDRAGDLLAGRAHEWDLVRHLVASHHGACRALAPWVADPNPVSVSYSRDGVTTMATSAHELARLDSGIAERFGKMVRRYGWWGLAWLETTLRLADHRQSEREHRRRRKGDA